MTPKNKFWKFGKYFPILNVMYLVRKDNQELKFRNFCLYTTSTAITLGGLFLYGMGALKHKTFNPSEQYRLERAVFYKDSLVKKLVHEIDTNKDWKHSLNELNNFSEKTGGDFGDLVTIDALELKSGFSKLSVNDLEKVIQAYK